MNFYSNNQILYDYYNTNVYKNQYQSTFQNGGYLQSSFIHPKGISHPQISMIQNGKKVEYQTEKISLFSTNNCKSIEDVIPEKESGLLDSILSDNSFSKYLEKYGLKRKEIHSWLVIQHVPITNSDSNLYVIFLLQTNSTVDNAEILPDSLDQWILQSEDNKSNLKWMTNFMNSTFITININDYLSDYSNQIPENKYRICENENVVFIKEPISCSFIPIQTNKIMEGLNNHYNILGFPNKNNTEDVDELPGASVEYPLNNGGYIMECDDHTPDTTNFYYYANNNSFSSIFLMTFFWIFILFVVIQVLFVVFFYNYGDMKFSFDFLKQIFSYDFLKQFFSFQFFKDNLIYIILLLVSSFFVIIFLALLTIDKENKNYNSTNKSILFICLCIWVVSILYFMVMSKISMTNVNNFTTSIIILLSIWLTLFICGKYSDQYLKFNDNSTTNNTYYIIITLYCLMPIFGFILNIPTR